MPGEPHKASLILMDEPTSALSSREVEALFALMRRWKDKGVAVFCQLTAWMKSAKL
ncbi:MAG: hypothetical protein U0401_32735 [Anaerolineae bacterium]